MLYLKYGERVRIGMARLESNNHFYSGHVRIDGYDCKLISSVFKLLQYLTKDSEFYELLWRERDRCTQGRLERLVVLWWLEIIGPRSRIYRNLEEFMIKRL